MRPLRRSAVRFWPTEGMTKQQLRQELKSLRNAIPPEGKRRLDHLIQRRIASSRAFRTAKTVLLYAPVNGEIDLLPLVRLCRRQGKQVGFPVTDTGSKTIRFRQLTPEGRLSPGAYGIPEPPADAPLCRIDSRTLCLLPGLSFDRSGNRLGYGAGYYDRFLASFPGVTLGAVYEKLMRDIPAEPHDIPVRLVVNERELIVCSRERARTAGRIASGARAAAQSAANGTSGTHTGAQNRSPAGTRSGSPDDTSARPQNPTRGDAQPARDGAPAAGRADARGEPSGNRTQIPPREGRQAASGTQASSGARKPGAAPSGTGKSRSSSPRRGQEADAGIPAYAKQLGAKIWLRLSEWLAPLSRAFNRWLQAEPGKQKKNSRDAAPAAAPAATPRLGPPLLVLVTFLFLILSRFIDGQLTRRGSEYITVILLQLLIFVLPAVLYIQLRGEQFPSRIRMKPLRPEHLWLCFCVLVVLVCGNLLLSIMTGGIASLGGNFTLYNIFVARINGSIWETIYVILAYAVLPAFCEELVYRSVLCADYEGAGVGVAVAVSSIFFAMLHFSFPLFINYLFSGLLLAGVMYATRSTLGSMLIHLLYNLFCLFGQPYLSAFYVNAGSSEIFIFCLIVLLLLFAAFSAGEARKIYHLYAKNNVSSDYTTPVRLADYPRRIGRVLLTPTAAAAAVVWLIMAILDVAR